MNKKDYDEMIGRQLENLRHFYQKSPIRGINDYLKSFLHSIAYPDSFLAESLLSNEFPIIVANRPMFKKKILVSSSTESTLALANIVFNFSISKNVTYMTVDQNAKPLAAFGIMRLEKMFTSIKDLQGSKWSNLGSEVPFIIAAYPKLFADGEIIPLPSVARSEDGESQQGKGLVYRKVKGQFYLRECEISEYKNFTLPTIEWLSEKR